jgi:hypothetical protein
MSINNGVLIKVTLKLNLICQVILEKYKKQSKIKLNKSKLIKLKK